MAVASTCTPREHKQFMLDFNDVLKVALRAPQLLWVLWSGLDILSRTSQHDQAITTMITTMIPTGRTVSRTEGLIRFPPSISSGGKARQGSGPQFLEASGPTPGGVPFPVGSPGVHLGFAITTKSNLVLSKHRSVIRIV